jgi:hypothetical protein
MDIKKDRRDAVVTGSAWGRDLPEPNGMYPGAGGNPNKKGQGSAASDNNVGWDMRAQSWQRGADTDFQAIQNEKDENDKRFGVPCVDSFPAPSDPKGPKNCGARCQTASYDANDTLPSPANWSNNPGYMGTSTLDAATSGNPANGGTARVVTGGSDPGRALQQTIGRQTSGGGTGPLAGLKGSGSTIGRSSRMGNGNVSLPAPGDTDPGSEGSPLVVSSGYSG